MSSQKPPIVVGLCGGIGSGKSYVAELLKDLGAQVFDADRVGHNVLREDKVKDCLLYTSPSPRDRTRSRMPSSA